MGQTQVLAQRLTLLPVGGAVTPVEVSQLQHLEVAHLGPLALLLMVVLPLGKCLAPVTTRTPCALRTK